jgi:hypothetical protein
MGTFVMSTAKRWLKRCASEALSPEDCSGSSFLPPRCGEAANQTSFHSVDLTVASAAVVMRSDILAWLDCTDVVLAVRTSVLLSTES